MPADIEQEGRTRFPHNSENSISILKLRKVRIFDHEIKRKLFSAAKIFVPVPVFQKIKIKK